MTMAHALLKTSMMAIGNHKINKNNKGYAPFCYSVLSKVTHTGIINIIGWMIINNRRAKLRLWMMRRTSEVD